MALRMFRVLIFAAGFILQAQAETRCELHRYGELPVTMIGMRPIVQGTINGQRARFLADSGAFFSVLSTGSAARFNLKLDFAPINFWVNGVTDSERPRLTKAGQFTLDGFMGGHVFKDINFIVLNDVVGDGLDGIIGENALGGADTEYDLGNGMIRLFQSEGCRKHSLAYWQNGGDVAEMDIEEKTSTQPHIVGTAVINGKKIRVVFDTGAVYSILTLSAAKRAGIRPEDESVKSAGIAGGIGGKLIDTWIAHFDTLDIGGELIKNARLRMGDIHLPMNADMLLGADFFLSHRIYVSAKENRIFFTYNGGPVFDLKATTSVNETRMTDVNTGNSASSANSSLSSEASATDMRLRGAALAGRHEYQQAIADLNMAVKLDGKDPESFYQRGLAYSQNHQFDLALADFDQTLKLKPDDVAAFVARGTVQLEQKNTTEARADFDSALKLAPHDDVLTLQIAAIYGAHKYYEEEIQRLNAWMADDPKKHRSQWVLNERCHARLMTGKELPLALEDCNLAKKLGSAYSTIYSNRGLVYLRLGDVDKSMKDLHKALKMQPKDAHALYGLAIAEQQKGLIADSERDTKAAVAIDPDVEKFFDESGMSPKPPSR
ncbi:MAG: tetratricopeptide repeat protein [Steroidobacter sp.]